MKILALVGLLLVRYTMAPPNTTPSDLRADETVVFFPTCAHLDDRSAEWLIPIHGWVFEPEVDSRKRRALLSMLSSTFMREFESVPGMATLYTQWAAEGAAVHYVSASPWQLYEPLAEFLESAGFPQGSFHLKLLRWRDSSFVEFFSSPQAAKRESIENLIRSFPHRQFILVGDTGQKDPEIYGAIARRHQAQIIKICIRNVSAERSDGERCQRAFEGVPRDRWQLFDDPQEIELTTPSARRSE